MELSKYIDHTLLKADATKDMITTLCQEAKEYDFMSVCVNPYWVPLAHELLKDSDVEVCTVVGFPLGANSSSIKAAETRQAIADGATEIDMVVNVGAIKSGDWDTVLSDIQAVVDAANGTLVKVIIETCLLTDEEKVRACELAKEAEADFVKTSTGFLTGGATVEDIRLMRQTVGDIMGVKASGGVSNYDDAMAMIEAGATRIGASKGIQIVTKQSVESSNDNY